MLHFSHTCEQSLGYLVLSFKYFRLCEMPSLIKGDDSSGGGRLCLHETCRPSAVVCIITAADGPRPHLR